MSGNAVTSTFTVQLLCGHSVTYAYARPRPGDMLFCVRCDTWRPYDKVSKRQARKRKYRVNCQECSYRRARQDPDDAAVIADTHALSEKHFVDVRNPDGVIIRSYPPGP